MTMNKNTATAFDSLAQVPGPGGVGASAARQLSGEGYDFVVSTKPSAGLASAAAGSVALSGGSRQPYPMPEDK